MTGLAPQIQTLQRTWGDGGNLQAEAKMHQQRAKNSMHTLLTDLKACIKRRDLQWGRKLHMKAVETQRDSNMYVVTALVRMYAKCGSMVDARRIFDAIQNPNIVCWDALLVGYTENGNGHTTLELFFKMKACGCAPDSGTYVAALKACTSLIRKENCAEQAKCLKQGKEIHSEIGHNLNIIVQNTLINMYAKFGSMREARGVFDSIHKPDVVSWTSLLMGYAENGDGLTTLEMFSRMKACGYAPNSVTYVAAVKACTSLVLKRGQVECLKWGREMHSEIGVELNFFVQNTLIDMYAKCGSMMEARSVFEKIQNPNVVSWTALLLGYAENGEGLASLQLFSKMKASGCSPNSVTYVAALKACTSLMGNADGDRQRECLKRGKQIHSEIGRDLDIFVQSTLINMYGKGGSMVDARNVFDGIRNPDVVAWNALLLGYVENGDGRATLESFTKMKLCRCTPNSITYTTTLKACTSFVVKRDGGGLSECLKWGRIIHSEIGYDMDICVRNALIRMYSKCGRMVDAHEAFDSIDDPGLISWNALLLGYAENGNGRATLKLFSRMKVCGYLPDSVTFVAALKACTSLGDGIEQGECLKLGREIHLEISWDLLDIFVQSTLVSMYANCGSMVEALSVFKDIQKPDVVAWNALLLGYVEEGEGLVTLELFSKMKSCRCLPDSHTYVAALKACICLVYGGDKGECLRRGREIHIDVGHDADSFVQSTLIDMYSKCGIMVEARRVFDGIRKPDLVSWTALLMGYAENGDGFTTLDLLAKMKACGCQPDSVTYVAVLKACGLIGALEFGRKFHTDISEFNISVVTCLVDFYAKCGSMVEACEVFNLHSTARVVSTWNALLAGYGSFGDTDSMFKLLKEMQEQGFQPDAVTFVCMLSCCSHAGLTEKARDYFEAMPIQYGVTPTVMHYTCMIDALGRANRLSEAITILRKMPCNPDAVTWMTLLGACRNWKNVEIGRCAFRSLLVMDKRNASAYVLMAHIYGSLGMWEDQERVLEMKIKAGAWELPGSAPAMDELDSMVRCS